MNKRLTLVGINSSGPFIHHRSFYTCLNGALFLLCACQFAEFRMCVKEVYCHFPYDYTWNNASSLSYSCNHQFRSDNGLAMRRNISNVLCVIGAPLFESTLAPRRSIAFRNSAGTWSRAPGKQFGVLDRWRDRHTRPARRSDTLRIRPVRWWKWNRIRIDLARLADPISQLLVTLLHKEPRHQQEQYWLILWNSPISAPQGFKWLSFAFLNCT